MCDYKYYALRLAFNIVRRAFKIVRRAFKNRSLEHLKTIWCVIAARSRYGIGRDDDESKLA